MEGIKETKVFRMYIRVKSTRTKRGWVNKGLIVVADTREEAKSKARLWAQTKRYEIIDESGLTWLDAHYAPGFQYFYKIGNKRDSTII